MQIHREAALAEALGERGGGAHRRVEARQDDRLHGEPARADVLDEAQHLGVVGRAEVGAVALVLDVAGVGADDELDLVAERLEHPQLHVRLEAGQHARGVQVLEQLSPDLEVELVAEAFGALADRGGLEGDVLLVVEGGRGGRGGGGRFHGPAILPERPRAEKANFSLSFSGRFAHNKPLFARNPRGNPRRTAEPTTKNNNKGTRFT